jgi:hypothetical protein
MKNSTKQNGQALILSYLVIAFFTILSVPLFTKIYSENLSLNRQLTEKQAFYLAAGGVEDATNQFINYIANNFLILDNVDSYTPVVSYVNLPSGAALSSSITKTNAASSSFIVTDPDGINVRIKPFTVTATCTLKGVTATINQVMIVRSVYAFQHAVFYNDDLELFPGKPMTFTGRIFSNKDIYIGSDSTTLTIDSSYLRTAANIYNYRKDGSGSDKYDGTVDIQINGTSNHLDMHSPPSPYPSPLDSRDPNWVADAQSAWNGTIKTSANGVTQKATPVVGSIMPGGYYNTNANIVITDSTTTPIRQGPDGSRTALVQGGAPSNPNSIPSGTISITTTNSFYNAREEGYVKMVTIDLSKLDGYARPTDTVRTYASHLPANGLIYATVTNPGTREPGIRLKNGEEISRAGGLTVVTNDPLYIQGDYNSDNRKPCAVISDSLNILSNDWQDGDSDNDLSDRIASTTTVNAAFIAGIDTTSSGNYNGGLENYPRFLEDWSGRYLDITGSFVEMWNDQIAHGTWNTPDVYSPPNRRWAYDTNFATGNVPPFTPWTVEAQRGAWWKN